MKKLKIFLLTLLMVFTILPVNTLADGEITSTPDVSVYATKEQMMDGTFAPKSDGTAENIGKIIFGKNSSGNQQEWYVLGKDSGVSGVNTVIFATSPIETNQVFKLYDENNAYTYTYEKGTGYGDSDGTIEVYGNHYGASDLRAALRTMAADENYFTLAEQNLMNLTTVTTNDTKYNLTYTTTDKLYALAAKGWGITIIEAGSSNQIRLEMTDYWSSISLVFWLRTPSNNRVLHACNRVDTKDTVDIEELIGVRPASNIDLANVLFASAAKAGSTEIIYSNEVMTLRLDGKEKNIGEVYYDEENKEIIVSRGSTENKVHLILQGKDTRNWYYSKEITGEEVIKASDIEDAIGLTPELILSNSKIWLEITDTDGMKYAVEANKAIKKVEINGIEKPYLNGIPDTTATCTSTGVSNTTYLVSWKPENNPFGYYTEYTSSVTLRADEGYGFVDEDEIEATVNGKTATSVKKNDNGTLTVAYTFDSTAQDEFDSIPAMTMEVDSATDLSIDQFPTEADVIGKSGIVYKVRVMQWSKKSEDPLVYEGVLAQLPETLKHNFNDGPATVQLTITVKPAEIVPTPPAKEGNTYDDGGPFTTDICGNIYDRWGNKIYTAPGCKLDDGYVVPNTGVK